MTTQNKNSLLVEFMVLVEKIIKGEKEPQQYIEGLSISRSEIHLMALIASSETVHISEIARILNVTKGAISKTVRKLEKKGLAAKHTDPANNSRILIRLTDQGINANAMHEKIHNEMNADFMAYYQSLDPQEVDTIVTFLRKAQGMSEKHL
ncbi:MarR family winged helix-turn-helix transcriptional regulator [Desulfoluna spongiiphila]|uniref:DNA-binding transcriptional regulator, MarR family n=1 Tax=Desulfoluna spongiiphila TaxID=419481 RepID=A0A1G5F4B6_9BACT|nr:MarR family transcriptional regulator [Desulfoluna spongiiphila]SCY34024.1 DNA-binding transcriptional regulator, MarR family [Desulfoluna spongiiphila]